MVIKWNKKGLVFNPSGRFNWMSTHAALPIAEWIGADYFRIYFSTRDEFNRAQVGYIEIDITQPKDIIFIAKKPVLSIGNLGCFDDNGVMAEWIVKYKGIKYMYYYGWNKGTTVPYYIWVGLAINENRKKVFKRISKIPILDRNQVDPYLTTGPCVMVDNNVWRMWYVSSTRGWENNNCKLKPYYHIKYAESKNGIYWTRDGIVCIDIQSDNEYGIGRPCIQKENGIYRMWYSYSKGYYRIGYAESIDGIKWQRKDTEVGIDVSESGWDSKSLEYAFVFNHKGNKYMLYNGNNYGEDGFGLAIAT